jgi:hypothetical protein
MLSSISSSELAAPLKGGLAALATIGAAWLVTPAILAFDDQPMQSVATLNELVIERYILQHSSRPVVFVGSSILAVMPPSNCRPDNVASLTIQGGSPMTGVEAIHRIGARPQVLFFEATTSYAAADPRLIDSIFVPLYWQARASVQPLNHNRNWAVMLYRAMLPATPAPLDLPKIAIEDWDKQIEPKIALLKTPGVGPRFNVDERTAAVATELRALHRQGTRVIIHSPIDRRLNESSPGKEWLEALRAQLSEFEWFEQPKDLPLYRWEGLHFLSGSGLHYFNYLMKRAGSPFQPKCEPPAIFGYQPPA